MERMSNHAGNKIETTPSFSDQEMELLSLFDDDSLSSDYLIEAISDSALICTEGSDGSIQVPDEPAFTIEADLKEPEPVTTFSYQDTGVLIPSVLPSVDGESVSMSDLQILERILVHSRDTREQIEQTMVEEQAQADKAIAQAEAEGRVIWIEDYHPLTGLRCRIPIIIDESGIARSDSPELHLNQEELQELVDSYEFSDGTILSVDTIADYGFVSLATSMAAAACPDGCGGGGHDMNGSYGTLFSFPTSRPSHSHTFGEKGITFYYCPKCKKTGHEHGKATKCKCGNKKITILKSKKDMQKVKAA